MAALFYSTMEGQTVNITYESLFDISRNEMKEGIQHLPQEFYRDLVTYLKEKGAMLEGETPLSDAERNKIAKQLHNVHNIVRGIYERRETKILNLSLISARGSDVDTSALLPLEFKLFERLRGMLRDSRRDVLASLLRGEVPKLHSHKEPEVASAIEQTDPEEQSSTKLVRFLIHVPKFVGTELEVHGPFEPGDIANLPVEIANLLVKKERATPVS